MTERIYKEALNKWMSLFLFKGMNYKRNHEYIYMDGTAKQTLPPSNNASNKPLGPIVGLKETILSFHNVQF